MELCALTAELSDGVVLVPMYRDERQRLPFAASPTTLGPPQ